MIAIRRIFVFTLLLVLATHVLAGTGRVLIINRDPPGAGFNDPTPAAPVGGNDGTTIGQQRLKVFERAGQRWLNVLDTDVDIRVRASFASLICTTGSVVLGQARPETWHSNFPNAPLQDVWYPAALANKLAGSDLSPNEDDIFTQFNSALDNATCLGDRGWYYGFDGKEETDNALYTVVLHELGHGLGFVGRGAPEFFLNRPSVFDTNIIDVTAGQRWNQMSQEQRLVSMTNTGNLAWAGPNTTERTPLFLDALTTFTVTAPAPVARDYQFGTASFGVPANGGALTGTIVAAADEANAEGPAATDGCTTYSNMSEVAGKIALVDRGTCSFVKKALEAQSAGAIGLVIVDNGPACAPPSMGGTDLGVRIPVVSLTQQDGNGLRAQTPSATVSAILRVDPSRRAGATSQGYVRLYAPCTLEPGSSVYHFDTVASPNLLMEPSINGDLLDTVDLTLYLLMDIGWTQPPRTGRRGLRR